MLEPSGVQFDSVRVREWILVEASSMEDAIYQAKLKQKEYAERLGEIFVIKDEWIYAVSKFDKSYICGKRR